MLPDLGAVIFLLAAETHDSCHHRERPVCLGLAAC
jgi:hypothetical protein